MWTIARIDEADFGCEERLPGMPLMLLVTLENEEEEEIRFEVPENWIESQGLEEGDEWPEDLEAEDKQMESIASQSEWMENYYRANLGHCVGMAANMIGVRKNIIVVAAGPFQFAMINPKITKQSGAFFSMK